MALRCNGCERDLTPHCKEPTDPRQSRCEWWTCTNGNCDHEVYDLTLMTLRHKDDSVEKLAG